MTEIRASIPIEIDDQTVEDIIVTAFEGGCNYWVNRATINHPDGDRPHGTPSSTWAAAALNKGSTIVLTNNIDGDEKLTRNGLLNGIDIWIKTHPRRVWLEQRDDDGKFYLDTGNIDANDADAIVQYAVFGKLVYG